MEALLILAGLFLLLSAWALLLRQALRTAPLWALACLLPPLALLYGWRQRAQLRLALSLAATALLLWLVTLAGLLWLEPQRLDAWREFWQPAARLGELAGQPFQPQRLEWQDGRLLLRAGEGFFARQSLQLRLPADARLPLRLRVTAEQTDPAVSLELSWLPAGSNFPETRQLQQGFALRLWLDEDGVGQARGHIHLELPEALQTRLDGPLQVTLPQVAAAESVAARPQPLHEPASAGREEATAPAAAPAGARAERPRPAVAPFSLAALQRQPQRYLQARLRIQRLGGGQLEGRFIGLDEEGNLRLVRRIGSAGGQAGYSINPQGIARIELLEP